MSFHIHALRGGTRLRPRPGVRNDIFPNGQNRTEWEEDQLTRQLMGCAYGPGVRTDILPDGQNRTEWEESQLTRQWVSGYPTNHYDICTGVLDLPGHVRQ